MRCSSWRMPSHRVFRDENVFAPLDDPDVDVGIDAANAILDSTYTISRRTRTSRPWPPSRFSTEVESVEY